MAPAPALDDIDLSDLEFWARPLDERAAAFATLREERPIARMVLPGLPHLGLPETAYYSVTRHADIVQASRHPSCSAPARAPRCRLTRLRRVLRVDVAWRPPDARMRPACPGLQPRQLEMMKTDARARRPDRRRHRRPGRGRLRARGVCRRRADRREGSIPAAMSIRVRQTTCFSASRSDTCPDVRGPMLNAAILTAGRARQARPRSRRGALKNRATSWAASSPPRDGEKLARRAAVVFISVEAWHENTPSHRPRQAGAHRAPRQHHAARRPRRHAPTAVYEIIRWASPVIHVADGHRDGLSVGQDLSRATRCPLVLVGKPGRAVFADPLRLDLAAPRTTHRLRGPARTSAWRPPRPAEVSVRFRELCEDARIAPSVSPTGCVRASSRHQHLPVE